MKLDQIFTKIIVGFPKSVLGIFILLSIGALLLIPKLENDPTPYLLPTTHESRVNLNELRKNYTGANDSILVLLEAEKTVFNRRTLQRIKNLTAAFEQIHLIADQDRQSMLQLSKGASSDLAQKLNALSASPIDSETWLRIDEIRDLLEMEMTPSPEIYQTLDVWTNKLSPIVEVTSLANTDNILGEEGRLSVDQIYSVVPGTQNALKQLEKQVLSNELFDNILVAGNGKRTSIILELDQMDDRTHDQYLIYQQVKEIVEKRFPGNERHYIAGLPVVTGALGNVMEQDTQRLFPIVICIVVLCLFFTFRQFKGILIPLAVVILSLIITLGLKVLFGVPLNIITTTLPVFILSIGVADGIHMFSDYRDNLLAGFNKKEAITRMMSHLTMPVIMTSLTTGAAFYAISLTQIVQLKHFGIFVSVGTLVAMLFSLLFVPALLMVLPQKIEKKSKSVLRSDDVYAGILIRVTHFVLKQPFVALSIALTVLIVSLFGASKVVVDNNNAGYFLENSSIFISSEKLNADAAGSSTINLLVRSDLNQNEPFKDSQNLKYVDELIVFMKSRPEVGKVLGLTELIKRINFAINDEDPAFNMVPEVTGPQEASGSLISQLFLLYENGGGDVLTDLTDNGYTRLNIPIVLRTNSSLKITQFIDQVNSYVTQNFPDHLKIKVSGSANVSVAATDEIVNGQMKSLIVSLVVVLVMLLFTFRKISYAAIAMVPLVMTIAINFGIMGFFKIPLDIGTAIISSIVIGIGVDYGIHYLSRLRKNMDRGMAFNAALDNTIRHSGKAIFSNAVTVGLGFVALLFSVLTPLIIMGWMITITMLVSAVSTLILIPVCIVFFEKRVRRTDKTIRPRQLAFHPQQN